MVEKRLQRILSLQNFACNEVKRDRRMKIQVRIDSNNLKKIELLFNIDFTTSVFYLPKDILATIGIGEDAIMLLNFLLEIFF